MNLFKTTFLLFVAFLTACSPTEHVNVNVEISGGGDASPLTQRVKKGATASFVISPFDGYTIENVSGCDGMLKENLYITHPLQNDCTARVVFKLKSLENTVVGRRNTDLSFYRVTDKITPIDVTLTHQKANESHDSFSVTFGEDIGDSDWILVKASGGIQLDADYNGFYDTPERDASFAEVYAFAQAENFETGIHISEMSDLAWRFTSDYLGEVHFDDLNSRYELVSSSLSTQENFNTSNVLTWDIDKRTTFNEDHHYFLPVNMAYSEQSEPQLMSYIEAIDAGASQGEIVRLGGTLLSPSLVRGVNGGKQYSKITLSIIGPGSTSSSITEFNLADDIRQAAAFVHKNDDKQMISATPKTGSRFDGWFGCPNVLPDQSCQVSGSIPGEIYAMFSVEEQVFVDGTFEIPSCVTAQKKSDSEYLFSTDENCLAAEGLFSSIKESAFLLYTGLDFVLFAETVSTYDFNEQTIGVFVKKTNLETVVKRGTFKAVNLDTSISFTSNSGQVFTAHVGDTLIVDDTHISVLADRIIYTQNGPLSIDVGPFQGEIELVFDVDMGRSRFSLLENFDFLSLDIIADLTFELNTSASINPFSKSISLYKPPTIYRTAIFPVVGLVTMAYEPEINLKGSVDIDGLFSASSSAAVNYSVGAGFTLPYPGASISKSNFRGLSNIASSNAESSLNMSITGQSPLTTRINATLSADGTASIGLYGAQFFFLDQSAGAETFMAIKNLNPQGGTCRSVEAGGELFIENTLRIGLQILALQVLGDCSICERIKNSLNSLDFELYSKKGSVPFVISLGESINSFVENCASKGMTLTRRLPQSIDYAIGHAGLDYYNLYIKNISHLRNPPVFTFKVKNSSKLTMPVSASFEKDSSSLFKISPSGIQELQPGQELTFSLIAKTAVLRGHATANGLRDRKLEHVITIKNESPGSTEIEKMNVLLNYVNLPQHVFRFFSGTRSHYTENGSTYVYGRFYFDTTKVSRNEILGRFDSISASYTISGIPRSADVGFSFPGTDRDSPVSNFHISLAVPFLVPAGRAVTFSLRYGRGPNYRVINGGVGACRYVFEGHNGQCY